MSLEQVHFNLGDLVDKTLEMFVQSAGIKGLELVAQRDPPDLPMMVRGDPFRLRQVLANLINNAIKFTPHGKIVVRVNLTDAADGRARVHLSVEDSGVGIAPAAQEKIFEHFAQADGSTTRQFGATGLGLAICKRLVELMEGSIGVESTPGMGAKFWVDLTLPKAKVPSPAPTRQLDITTVAANGNEAKFCCRVLLAEDNPVNQQVAAAMLSSLGLQVDIANNGQEAVTKAYGQAYDIILMDCQMPVMDGYQATAEIREQETAGSRRSPIVALTANAMEGDRTQCLAAGMDDYLAKPYSMNQLRQVLSRWLEPETHANSAATPAVVTLESAPEIVEKPAAIDSRVLDQLRKLDPSGGLGFAHRILRIYLDTSGDGVRELGRAIAEGDADSLRRAAHTLKSSTANVGATTLSDLFKQLEAQGRAADLDGAPALLDAVRREYGRALDEIHALLAADA